MCLLLCLVLVWGYSYKEPTIAYASEVEVGVAIDEALTAALKALGIGIAGTVTAPMYQQILKNMKTDAVMTAFAGCTGAVVGAKTVYNLTTNFLTTVGNQIKAAYDTAYLAINNPLLGLGVSITNSNYNKTFAELGKELGATNGLTQSGYVFGENKTVSSYTILDSVPVASGSPSRVIKSISCGSKEVWIKSYSNSSGYYPVSYDSGSTWPDGIRIPATNSSTLGYILAVQLVGYTGVSYYLISTTWSSNSNVFALPSDATAVAVPAAPGRDVYGTDVDKWFADGYSALNNSVSDVVGRVGDAVGVTGQDGTKTIPVSIPVGSDTDVEKGRTASQSDTLNKDIATTDDKTKNETTNKGKDTSLPKPAALPDLSLPEIVFKEKFPFCLPWDLYTAFSNLVAAPTPPKWDVPFTVKSLNFSQNITIDFSQFSVLATILRWGLSLIFVIFLILITRKMIGQGG